MCVYFFSGEVRYPRAAPFTENQGAPSCPVGYPTVVPRAREIGVTQ